MENSGCQITNLNLNPNAPLVPIPGTSYASLYNLIVLETFVHSRPSYSTGSCCLAVKNLEKEAQKETIEVL